MSDPAQDRPHGGGRDARGPGEGVSLPKDRWSDSGDPRQARNRAWTWVAFACIAWGLAGLVWFAWWIAQRESYQDNFRGFDAGDDFPWLFMILCVVVGIWCLPVARKQWARARLLARDVPNR